MTTDTVRALAEASRRPSRGLRQLVPWLLALAVATCTQDNLGPSRGGTGYFSFRPVYPLADGASLSQFGIVADSVHVLLTRPVDQIVLDTTVPFPADSAQLRLALPIELATSPEVLDALIEISAGGIVIFRDSLQVTVKDGAPGNTPPPTATFDYVGPGSNIGTLAILPGDTTLTLGDTLFFTASAFDSSDAVVPNFYVGWKTSDTLVARVNGAGRLIAPLLRGTVRVIGMTPTGISDTTTVTFAPVPVIITADSGNFQTGIVGDSLSALFVARVKGADSLGISGIPVRFAAVTAGGIVRDTITLFTDATGRVRTQALFGTVAGSYSYTATALGTGLPARTFTATATGAALTVIAIQSGNGQIDTTGHPLPLPFVVKVTDAFGNPGPATVIFTRLAGTGVLADDTVFTDGTGLASVGYTLGASAGTDTIQASLPGGSASVLLTATGIASLPTQLIQGLGDGQSAAVTALFTDSLTVQVLDASDNPVSGIWVQWLVTSGGATVSADSTLTDAAGHAAVALTAGTLANAFTVEASVAGIVTPVVFSETVTAGAPAAFTIASGNGQTGAAGAVLPLSPEVRIADAHDNPIAGIAVSFVVSVGGGGIDSATATTDSTGRANAGLWTLGLAGLNQVEATSAAFPADTLRFDATATPIGTSKLWTGLSTGSWGDPNSWSPVGVPGITDNVFLPASAPNPLSSVSTTIAGLTIESGQNLINDALLTVSGDADIGGTISGSGALTLSGSGGTLGGAIQSPVVNVTGNRSLSGTTTLSGALNVTGGSFSANGQTLTVGGTMTVSGGVLTMGGGTDSIDVAGNFTMSTGTSGTGAMTSGVLVLRGNLTQTAGSLSNFAASGTHRTILAGSGAQTVTFASAALANSHFANVEFANASGVTLNSNIAASATATVSAGTVTGVARTAFLAVGGLATPYSGWQVSTTDFSASPSVHPDSLARNVTITGPFTLAHGFKVDSAVSVTSSGVLTLNGQLMRVGTGFSTAGRVIMNAAADSLDIGGSFTVTAGSTGLGDLTAGGLTLRGNFTQTAGSFSNFAATGTHTTHFAGSTVQAISFGSPTTANSRFQNVEFANAAGVTLNSNIAATGNAAVTAGTVTGVARTAFLQGDLASLYSGWQVSTTDWSGAPAVYPDSLPRNVAVNTAWTLSKPFELDSLLTIGSTGTVTVNGQSLRVGRGLTQTGHLVMANAADTVDVGGLLLVNGGGSGTGDLSAGLLLLRGGIQQTSGSFSNFQPSGTHLTRFVGAAGQPGSFSAPAAGNSRFQNVEFADSVNFSTSIYVAGTTTILGGGKAQSLQTATLAGALADPTNGGWRFQNTTLTGTVTAVPDSMVTALTLSGSWNLAQTTRVTGNFTIAGGAVLDLNGDSLVVTGAMTQTGDLLSSLGSSLLDVGGTFSVNSSQNGAGDLTDGRHIIRGGFAQTAGAFNNYSPSGNFVTSFLGTGGHPVSFSSPSAANSHFNHLEVLDSLTLGTAFTATGDVSIAPAGRIVGANTGTLLGDLADPSLLGYRMASTSIPGGNVVPDTMTTDLTLTGTWALPGSFTLTGDLTLTGTGLLTANGHRLWVSGSLTQTGRLQMLLPADTVEVLGGLLVNSSSTGAGDLVDGRLILHAGFAQTAGSFSNFAPSSTHVTEFVGSGGHAISMSSPSSANSHFRDVVVRDSLNASTSITVTGDIVLAPTGRVVGGNTGFLDGDLVDSSLAGWRMASTTFSGGFNAIPESLFTNVTLNDTIALAQNTTVTGNWVQSGNSYIAFSGHGLKVTGNFTQTAHLAMNSTQDSLEVGGNFLVNSSLDGTGDLQAGVVVLHGGFTQTSGSFTNFVGAVPHRVRFTGPAARTISMATPAQTVFGDLAIDAAGAITLNNDVNVVGTTTIAGGPASLTAAVQRRLATADLVVDGATFDRIRVEMHGTSNAAQFDNVTFTNIDPTLTQLSLELPGQTGDTLKFTNVAFSGTPTTGRYLYVADSVANDAPAVIGFYNSTPLNGALYAAVEGTVGDPATILWTHLDWLTQPSDAITLLPILTAPQVAVLDPSGQPVSTFAGTVTLAFANDPTGGLAALANNSVAAVGGVATFDSLTVSLAGLGFTLVASNGQLGQSPPSAPFTISIPLPVGTTTAFNNAGGDNLWENAANWTFGIPDSLDNVYIFPGQTAAVNTPAQVNRMIVGTGGGVLLNAALTADSTVDAGNTITGGGQLVARGTGFLSGVTGGLVVSGNYLVPVNDTLTADYITISGAGAILDPGASRIVATDSLRTEAGGALNMNDAGAVVAVGRARFTGGAPALLAGTLEVAGDFSQEENVGAFGVGPSFTTVFNGGGTQTAAFFSPDTASDHFGHLVLTGGGTLHLAGTMVPILGNLDVQGGTVVIDTTALLLGTVTGSTGAFVQGATLMIRDNFAFGGVYNVDNTIFIGSGQTIQQAVTPFDTVYVQGTVSLAGNVAANVFFVTNFGQFDLGGRRLDVAADFGTGSGGIFDMNDAADTLAVGGTFYAMGGSTTGLLTDGLLQIAGSFYQGSTPADTIPVEVQGPPPAFDAFRATGVHVTRFVGAPGAQRIIFFGSPVLPADPFSTNNSRFGVLDLVDGIDSLGSTLPVDGDLSVDSARVVNAAFLSGGPAVAGNILVGANVPEFTVSNVSLGGALDFQPSAGLYQVSTTLFFGNGQSIPVLPYQDVEVALGQATLAGDLTVGSMKTGVAQEGPGLPGDLRLGGHTLTVINGFTTTGTGTFTMDDPADSLDVAGGIDLGGGVTTNVTAGTLVARGDLYLSDSTLVASGTHRTVFAAPVSQQLWVTTGPEASTQFNKVNILAGTTVSFNVFSSGPMQVLDSFNVAGTFSQANPGKTVIALGDVYVGTATNLVLGTLELHKTLDVDLSTYSVDLTRYAGTGQFIARNVNYNDVEVTGSAELDSTISVGRDFIVSGNGTFNLIGHTLHVGRDFRTSDNALVTMQDPADTLDVGYTTTFDGGDTDGLLTAGTLFTNYFTQGATSTTRAFRGSGTHRVVMRMQDPADQGTNVNLASGGPADSRFHDLVFAAGGTGGQVNLWGHLEVQDSFLVEPGATGGFFGQTSGATVHSLGAFVIGGSFLVMSFDTLDIGGTLSVPSSILNTPVTRFSGVSQLIPDTQSYQRLEITGTASPEGTGTITTNEIAIYGTGQFTLGANQRATTSGDFTTFGSGTLAMSGAGPDLFVGGNATFAGGSSGPLLGGGNIRVAGNFTTVAGASSDPFNSFNTGVTFQGSGVPQVVTLDPATSGSFRSVGILNPNGIQLTGLMLVTDSVGTSGPILGDSLYAFGSFFVNAPVEVQLRVFKTSGIFVGAPSIYDVERTHIMNANTLPNVAFDTLVVNADGVSAFYPLNANHLYVAGPGSPFSTGAPASLDLSIVSSVVTHTIQVDAHVEGAGAFLEIGEDTLNVGGDFYTSLGGTLRMSGSGALNVTGSTLFGGASQEGLLTSGTLQVGSGITQQAFSSPSSFRLDGTTLDLPLGPAHVMNFETPDSSYLPDLNLPGSGTLNLIIVNKAKVAGGIGAYGITIGGDTLTTDGQLSAGPNGLDVTLDRYEGPVFAQFQNVPTWSVHTTQFTGPGGLPFSTTFDFDTLIVSDSVIGQLSQLLKANYVEVTGPGNPKHIGAEPGVLVLSGGDGNTDLVVSGDVLVRGSGAAIASYQGNLSATGNFTVDQDAYLYSGGSFSGGNWSVNGDVLIDGASTVDSLVRGTLSVGGNFTQKNTKSDFSFAADSGFTTVFTGGGTHVVSFATPGSAAVGSHFGSLAFNPDAGLVMQTDTDLWAEGLLTTVSYATPVLQNTAPVLRTLTVRDVAVQGVTFDHLQLFLAKTDVPALGSGGMDVVNFQNFLSTEDQMVVDVPGFGAGSYSWSNFNFTQLATDGTDTGHYLVVTDSDGGIPAVLTISLGTNFASDPANYFVTFAGAVLNLFSP